MCRNSLISIGVWKELAPTLGAPLEGTTMPRRTCMSKLPNEVVRILMAYMGPRQLGMFCALSHFRAIAIEDTYWRPGADRTRRHVGVGTPLSLRRSDKHRRCPRVARDGSG